MQAQIRMAESGHSYHYTGLTTVHALMHEIRKDFKIQLEDQKIIIKTGQLLKSNTSFHSVHQSMKKTIPTNNSTALNPSLNSSEIKEIQCLYIYNQKELLKPIEPKPFNDQHHLKLLYEKFKEMSLLAENSYELKQFNEKISQKNIIPIIESISKRFKIPLENITHRFTRFHNLLNQRQYYRIQVTSLLDLIQNQDKARKLLIKSVEWTRDKRTNKKMIAIKENIEKQKKKQMEKSMKENSHLLSSDKDNYCSDTLNQLLQGFKQLQHKNALFFERLKNSKRQVTKVKFSIEEKSTINIDKKITQHKKKFEEDIKPLKSCFQHFCQEIIKLNAMLTKNKETKDATKQLIFVNDKITNFEKIVQSSVKELTEMYLELTQIHVKGQTQNIKIVFAIYVELIKAYEQLQTDVRKFEKQLLLYIQQKSHQQIKVSQFSENRNNNLPLKKQIKSPKKQQGQKRVQRFEESSVTRQIQNNMPKINSPIKSKICKNSLKSFNEETNPKNFEIAIRENKQLQRRLEFNRRLESLMKYCTDLCDREQGQRKSFKNSREFEENRIQLLSMIKVPRIDIDYSQTSDTELTQMYKKWLKENSVKYETEVDWQLEIVDLSNFVSRTLTAHIANNSNITERQKSMQKIMSVLSETFYKMMKGKVEKEVEQMRKTISKSAKNEDKELIQSLMRSNEDQQKQIVELQREIKRLQEQKKSSLESLEQAITPQTYQLLSEKYHDLMSNFKSIEEQNQALKNQTKSLEAQLLTYQQQVEQTTQKLIESYEESNASQLQKLNIQLKSEKDLTLKLNKEIKELKSELDVGKKNLLKQLKHIEDLFEKIEELSQEKEFYEKQFTELKNLLADKQVAIIKLQKQLEIMKKQFENQRAEAKSRNLQSSQGYEAENTNSEHKCQFSQEVIQLRQKNSELQAEIQSLDKELKEILFKETIDQQIQTELSKQFEPHEQQYRIKKGKENVFIASSLEQNRQTSKIISEQRLNNNNQNPMINEQATKQSPLNNFNISNELNFNSEQYQAVSQYYVSSMGQHWVTSAFNKFTHLVIGKTIEQGMSHIFLPFSSDIYIGVTIGDQGRNFTNYQDYVNHESSSMGYRVSGEPIYVLDLKEFNLKTNEMLRECSLVLVVKIDKKGQVSMGNKVMVSGKIQFALGFQDDDMVIKNYSHFLDE